MFGELINVNYIDTYICICNMQAIVLNVGNDMWTLICKYFTMVNYTNTIKMQCDHKVN